MAEHERDDDEDGELESVEAVELEDGSPGLVLLRRRTRGVLGADALIVSLEPSGGDE